MLISAAAAGWGLIGTPMLSVLLLAQAIRGILHILGWPFAFLDLLLNWLGQAILNAYDFFTRVCLLVARPIAQRVFPGVTDIDSPVGDANPQIAPAAVAVAGTVSEVPPQVEDPPSPPRSGSPHGGTAGPGGHIFNVTPEPSAPSSNWKPY